MLHVVTDNFRKGIEELVKEGWNKPNAVKWILTNEWNDDRNPKAPYVLSLSTTPVPDLDALKAILSADYQLAIGIFKGDKESTFRSIFGIPAGKGSHIERIAIPEGTNTLTERLAEIGFDPSKYQYVAFSADLPNGARYVAVIGGDEVLESARVRAAFYA
jgi:hypothetical protein